MSTLKGIDVSKHQGNINWANVKNAGIQFAIIRAGLGKLATQKDEQFENNYAGCKSNGIPVGAYWFCYAQSEADAKLEAQACISVLKGKTFEYPIWYDIEDQTDKYGNVTCSVKSLGKAKITAIAKAFLSTLEAAGYYVGVYSYKAALESYIDSSVRNKYPVWIAHTGVSKTTYSGAYGIWQYSWTGTVRGISGNVDMDYCYVDYPTKIKSGGYNGFAKGTTSSSTTSSSTSSSTTSSASTASSTTSSTFKSGDKITLSGAKLYASATTNTSASTKTGTFYIYSATVTNNRIRITTTAANAGKTPAGTYVTGWIDVSAAKKASTSTSTASSTTTAKTATLKSGDKVTLSGAKLYASATAKTSASTKTGTFYIYSATVTNNRIRITTTSANVGKTPAGTYVTGWIDVSAAK